MSYLSLVLAGKSGGKNRTAVRQRIIRKRARACPPRFAARGQTVRRARELSCPRAWLGVSYLIQVRIQTTATTSTSLALCRYFPCRLLACLCLELGSEMTEKHKVYFHRGKLLVWRGHMRRKSRTPLLPSSLLANCFALLRLGMTTLRVQ